MRYYNRPNSAKNFYTWERIFKGPHTNQLQTLTSAAVAGGSQLPATGGTYTSPDEYAETVICGGTFQKIGDFWGIQMCDAKASSTPVEYAISGTFMLQVAAGVTPTKGKPAYIIEASGLIHSADAAGRTPIGYFEETTTVYTAASLDLDGTGAVNYALVTLWQYRS